MMFTPLMGFAEAAASSRLNSAPIALVLPTIADFRSRLIEQHPSWIRIGEEDHAGMLKPTTILSRLQTTAPPRLLISHTDQLCSPLVATVQLVLPDRSEFISPIEIILNTKYAFQLLVWTRGGLLMLPPDSPPKAIAISLASHLRDCEALGPEWISRSRQAERTLLHRTARRKNQFRYLRSCVANAFSSNPENSAMTPLLGRIDEIERSVKGTLVQ